MDALASPALSLTPRMHAVLYPEYVQHKDFICRAQAQAPHQPAAKDDHRSIKPNLMLAPASAYLYPAAVQHHRQWGPVIMILQENTPVPPSKEGKAGV